MTRIILVVALTFCLYALGGCASTSAPVKIGGDTYMMSATGAASPFGLYSDADNIQLIQKGTQQCAGKGLEFELVSDQQSPTWPGHRGTATITFKCVGRQS
ncbi:MAG TPA: hypothetical protein VK580_10740 [Steroidobacteraceae bacterium]|jgi:hypothetical protein|nr:hypothetical protein [Steroidobacteraceae bacterium]